MIDLKFNFHSKLKIISIMIICYTLFLTMYKDDDFTGLIALDKKIEKINNKDETLSEEITYTLDRVLDRFSFVLATVSSVGYGDIIPKKRSLRIINSLFILTLIFLIFN